LRGGVILKDLPIFLLVLQTDGVSRRDRLALAICPDDVSKTDDQCCEDLILVDASTEKVSGELTLVDQFHGVLSSRLGPVSRGGLAGFVLFGTRGKCGQQGNPSQTVRNQLDYGHGLVAFVEYFMFLHKTIPDPNCPGVSVESVSTDA
jgi:hypothetical protein